MENKTEPDVHLAESVSQTMKEAAILNARGELNRLPCIFSAALAQRYAVCRLSEQATVGARSVLRCTQPVARAMCARMLGLLQEKAVFAMAAGCGKTSAASKKLHLQCGGLLGLQSVLDPASPSPDVWRLVELAQENYRDLERLPFETIVRHVVRWQPNVI